jgi:hypothetical protein
MSGCCNHLIDKAITFNEEITAKVYGNIYFFVENCIISPQNNLDIFCSV